VPAREPYNRTQEGTLPSGTSAFDPSAFAPPVRLPPFPFTNAEIPQEQAAEEDNNQDLRSSENRRQSRRETSPLTDITCRTDNDNDQENEIFASEDTFSTEPARNVRILTLPDYSPHLPQFDRTKTGEAFFADLYDKRLIPGYDQDRFSCWCHVAKRAENPDKDAILSKLHSGAPRTGGNILKFRAATWLAHAAKCAFYKVSLLARSFTVAESTEGSLGDDENGKGRRFFPQFPLRHPNYPQAAIQNEDEASAVLGIRGEKRKRDADPDQGQVMDEGDGRSKGSGKRTLCLGRMKVS
jgi:hypothetical protein